MFKRFLEINSLILIGFLFVYKFRIKIKFKLLGDSMSVFSTGEEKSNFLNVRFNLFGPAGMKEIQEVQEVLISIRTIN